GTALVLAGRVGQARPGDGAGILRARGGRIGAHDNERAERLDGTDVGAGRGRKAHSAADSGLDLAVTQRLRRRLGSKRPDFDLMGIKRRIDRQLMPAPGDADDGGRAEDANKGRKPFHRARLPSPRGKCRMHAGLLSVVVPLVMPAPDPRIHANRLYSRGMDCWVKPARAADDLVAI